jgi:alkaline phosphatase
MTTQRIFLFACRWFGAFITLTVLLLAPSAAGAQEASPTILIWPIDNAQFLPGAHFDVRVEVHADALPDDFAVTINGEEPGPFFGVAATGESWEYLPSDVALSGWEYAGPPASSEAEVPVPAQAITWRQVTAPAPGEYTLEVTAGGETRSVTWTVVEPQPGHARNVILFVGDGMTVSMITSARLVSRGMTDGKFDGAFVFDDFEEFGLSHTSSYSSIVTDSSAGASTLNTGHETANGAVGVYPDTSPDVLDDPRVETFGELVSRTRGMSVGVVSNAGVTDATPSAVYGHSRRRDAAARSAFAATPMDGGLMPEVMLGGDGRYFLPQGTEGSSRTDDRDLLAEYAAAGYTIVQTASELEGAVGSPSERLLGVFNTGDLDVWLDRNVYTDNLGDHPDQPGLDEMTLAALEVLNQNENGWYLEVESAHIDKRMHFIDDQRGLAELIEFEQAIAAAVEWTQANAPDTLIIVTADHGLTYDTYGTIDMEAFGAAPDDAGRLDAIDNQDDAGYPTYEDADGDFYPDNWDPSVIIVSVPGAHPPYTEDFLTSPTPRDPALRDDDGIAFDNPDDDPNGLLMPGTVSPEKHVNVHTLGDVPIFANGPGSQHFGKAIDNTEIFFGMAYAIGLDPSAADGMVDGVAAEAPAESTDVAEVAEEPAEQAAPAEEEMEEEAEAPAAEEPPAEAEAEPGAAEPQPASAPLLSPQTAIVAALIVLGVGFVIGLAVRRR